MKRINQIQFITDPRDNISIPEQVEEACKSGIKWVQYRNKTANIEEKIACGKELRKICTLHNAILIVNDSIEIAEKIMADGVHLGLNDPDPAVARSVLGSKAIVGGTCNTWEDILLRNVQNVDYIGLGPYRFTTTKKNLSPVIGSEGYKNLIENCKLNNIHLPVVAIGGITINDFKEILQTGVSGIALSSVILNAEDRIENTQKLINEFEKWKN